MRRRSAGLSLLEALMTLFLIGVVVLLSSGLLNGMSRMNRRSQEGESSVAGVAALEGIRREVLEAISISSPNSGAAVDELIFRKINPNAAGRLPNLPATWNPHRPVDMLSVKYSWDDGQVVRVATDAGGASSTTVVAHDVDAFTARLLGSGVVELKISFSQGDVLTTNRALARRYLP